jgi:hypothetical protein
MAEGSLKREAIPFNIITMFFKLVPIVSFKLYTPTLDITAIVLTTYKTHFGTQSAEACTLAIQSREPTK